MAPLTSAMKRNFFQTLMVFLGGLLCLVPLCFSRLIDFSTTSAHIALASQINRDAGVAALTLTLPILLDVTVEILSAFATRKLMKINTQIGTVLLNTRERFLLACGMLTISIVVFLPTETPRKVNIYLCLNRCRILFLVGSTAVSLCRLDPKFWTERMIYSGLTLMIISTIIGSFCDNISAFQSSGASTVALAMYLTSFGIFIFCGIRWLWHTTPKVWAAARIAFIYSTAESERIENKSNNHLLFPYAYVLTVYLLSLILIVKKRLRPDELVITTNSLFYRNLATNLYYLILIYISDKMIRHEIIYGLYALVESKRTYVRYISHELRTPLNSAFLGLKLVCDDFEPQTNERYAEYQDTLTDVRSACRIAVEILNDLLCFDKLESGILELHKHNVVVTPFIDDCVNMFASQAREAGVTITNNSHFVESQGLVSLSATSTTSASDPSCLLADDFVHMDKFKMDQVLRNLISNALKFTPRGGSVSVCATFHKASSGARLLDRPDALERNRRTATAGNACTPLSRMMSNINAIWNNLTDSGNYTNVSHAAADAEGVHVSASAGLMNRTTDEHGFCLQEQLGTTVRAPKFGRRKVSPILTESSPEVVPTGTPGTGSSWSLMTGGKLRIVVSDTGAGISDSNLRRLFKEIVQFNPEVLQAGGGSGLGLWITSSIVKMHGGSITAFSEGLGRGSTFAVELDMQRHTPIPYIAAGGHSHRFSLPRRDFIDNAPPLDGFGEAKASQSDLCLHQQSLDVIYGSSNNLDPRPGLIDEERCPRGMGIACASETPLYEILLVDDSNLNRKLLCKLFRSSGHVCEEASDGQLAIDMVRDKMSQGEGERAEYDAILMDFVMPNVDGPTATKRIRDLGYTGLIFGVTGNALASDIAHFVDNGVDAVFAKPFDFDQFKSVMARMRDSPV